MAYRVDIQEYKNGEVVDWKSSETFEELSDAQLYVHTVNLQYLPSATHDHYVMATLHQGTHRVTKLH